MGMVLFATRREKFFTPSSAAFFTDRQQTGTVVSKPTDRKTTSSSGWALA